MKEEKKIHSMSWYQLFYARSIFIIILINQQFHDTQLVIECFAVVASQRLYFQNFNELTSRV